MKTNCAMDLPYFKKIWIKRNTFTALLQFRKKKIEDKHQEHSFIIEWIFQIYFQVIFMYNYFPNSLSN